MAKLTKQDRKLILKGLQLMANELLKDVSLLVIKRNVA